MNSKAIIALDMRRERTDGTYSLILRISHQRRTTSIYLGYSVATKDFDEAKRIVKPSYKGLDTPTRINNYIQKKQQEANTLILKLAEQGKLSSLSASEIKELITASEDTQSFYSFTEQAIKDMHDAKRHGNARNYKSVLLAMKAFREEVDFTFQQLNYDFVKKFETHHLGKGNSYNGLAAYLRGLRAIYNKAVLAGVADKETNPFLTYRIKMEPTTKRALSSDALKIILKKNLTPTHPCFHVRNFFVASFFLYGISFMDMAFLKLENITDGRVRFKRRKTGKPYDIKITPQLQPILDYYTKGKGPSDFIFPFIKREELIYQYRDVDNQRKLYNEGLKDLGKLCGLDEKLTSYVSRHSFATQAMMQNVPLQAISAMMGHSKLSTTETYLKGLPSNILDEYNEKLLS